MKQDDLILYAFRYCLGKDIYAIEPMANCIAENWHDINRHYQNVIIHDIETALRTHRAGEPHNAEVWSELLDELKPGKVVSINTIPDGMMGGIYDD